MPHTHQIAVLGPRHHLRRLPTTSPARTTVHRARMLDPTGTTFRAYVKAFPPGSRGLVNELVGWRLHRARGLPTAPRAFVALVPVAKLRHYHPDATWLQGRAEPLWPAWVTEALPTRHRGYNNDATRRAQLCQWPDLHAAIAMREALHDIDCHGGNYVPLSLEPPQFAALDFAESLGGQGWTAQQLEELDYLHNKLLYDTVGLPSDLDQHKLEASGAAHWDAWKAAEPELLYWWQGLLRNPADRDSLHTTLARRLAAGWLKGRWK